MNKLKVLYVLTPGVRRDYVRKMSERVSERLERTMGYEIEPSFRGFTKPVPFASFEPENGQPRKWVPDFWMREKIGPLTDGEDLAMLCIAEKNWPRGSIVMGKIEYNPYNGTTYLAHILAHKNLKVRRGETQYELTEDSLFHEILHLFEDKAKKYGIVHTSINNLEGAAMALALLLQPALSPVPAPAPSPTTEALLRELQAKLDALLKAQKVSAPVPKPAISVPAPAQVPFPPPSGLQQLIARFGDPRLPDFEAKNILLFDLPFETKYAGIPVKRSRAHRLMIPIFKAVLQELKDKGLDKYVPSYGGIYANRLQRNGERLSVHAFGAAIDIAPELYPQGSTKMLPQAVVDVFTRHGFVHGRGFPVRDEMHWQWAKDY